MGCRDKERIGNSEADMILYPAIDLKDGGHKSGGQLYLGDGHCDTDLQLYGASGRYLG